MIGLSNDEMNAAKRERSASAHDVHATRPCKPTGLRGDGWWLRRQAMPNME